MAGKKILTMKENYVKGMRKKKESGSFQTPRRREWGEPVKSRAKLASQKGE